MKATQLWNQYQHCSRDVTEHGRKLGFAGVAICWFFRESNFAFPPSIHWALVLFVGYFALDLLQGVVGALRIKSFTESQEAKLWDETKSIDGDIEVPRSLDKPAFSLFIFKIVILLAGFIGVAAEILLRIWS